MLQLFPTAYWAILFLSCVCVYRKWSAHSAFRRAEAQNHCQRPRNYPHRDPIWGWDLYRIRQKAAQCGQFYKLYDLQFEQYGKTFEEVFFDTAVINTMEPANIQHVAVHTFQDWGRVGMRNSSAAPVLGDGIFSQDGAEWRHSRQLIKPTFARSEIADLSSLSIYTDRFLGLLPRDGSTTNVQPLLHRFLLDVQTNFLFGEAVNALLPDTPFDSLEFIQAFNASVAGIGKRRQAGRMKFLYAFDTSWKKSYDKVHTFIDNHVARALRETASDYRIGPDKASTLKSDDRFILLNEMAKEIRDPMKLRYQILHVFMAARDTTSILLGNTLFQLARNPHMWTDLRSAALAIGSQPLTYNVIQTLVPFRHVLFEVFRLQGPAGRVFRTALCDTILPVGGGPLGQFPILVQKGTVIALNNWSLNHDKDIWGDDVNDFMPQRWANRHTTGDFFPFFTGPRICPGQQLVLTQATYVLVRLVLEFERIENRDPVNEYVELMRMLTESRNGVQVALFPAEREK